MATKKPEDQQPDDEQQKEEQPSPFPDDMNMDSEPVEVGTDAPATTELKHHGVAQGVEVTEGTSDRTEAGTTDNSTTSSNETPDS